MFKLQRLEITGFKSFADYTEIIFTGDGVTAVVGPNGCGKSNISDAITWVLGEQKVKNLRGGEMQDVIFAGAKIRPPAGMAEVVLHLVRVESNEFINRDDTNEIDDVLSDFDELTENFEVDELKDNHQVAANGHGFDPKNSQIAIADSSLQTSVKRKWTSSRRGKTAALEFAPGEAVSVTRRLYRSGDSDYQLNGRSCRLRDIQDLFAGTGLSGGHYALIQQEKISQILSAKPADRRHLIEEAAGITKFRTRQRAAKIRIEAAKTNLRRISDIVSEVDKQANSLRRQAARTRRYKETGQILRELLAQVFSAENLELSAQLNVLETNLARATDAENRLTEAVKSEAIEAQAATEKARQAEDALSQIRSKISENALRRERLGRDFAHQTEQVADLKERNNLLESEIATLSKRFAQISEDANRLREKTQLSSGANESEASALRAAENNYQKQVSAATLIENEIEQIRQDVLRHTTASERLREIAKQQTNALEKQTELLASLEKEGTRAKQTHLDKISELDALKIQLDFERQTLLESQNIKQTALRRVRETREATQNLENALSKMRDESNAVNARRDALTKLDQNNTLLAPAVQKLFAERDKIGVQLRGTLADFLQVEARYEKAVAAAFGSHLQTVLIEQQTDVEKILRWVKTAKAGVINLLIADCNKQKISKSDGAENKIGAVLNISDELRTVLQTVLAPVMDLQITEDLAQAATFNKVNCVTLAGEIVYQNKLFAFGETQSNGNILSFKRELRELFSQSEMLTSELEKAVFKVSRARDELITAEKDAAEIQDQIVGFERSLMSIEINAQNAQQEIERAKRHKKIVEDERRRIEIEQTDLETKQLKTSADLQTAENALKKATSELSDNSLKLTRMREQVELINRALSEQRAVAAANNERRRALANALRRIQDEHAETKSRLENRHQALIAAVAKVEQFQNSLVDLKIELAGVDQEKESEAQEIAIATRELTSARRSADKRADELARLNAHAAQAKDARAALELDQAKIVINLQNLTNVCQQELNQALSELPPAAIDFDLSAGKREIENLREKIAGFGAVNLLALDELSEAEERLLFLTSQRRDIVDGIEAAENALNEIKNRSRERFEFAFAEINHNFTALFSEIFGGGRGEMSLLDAADVLESGVEIVAQPPGKRLQNLLLLSGGEKALTAIALVLAIFRFRPAPFCLLDEVDAPLDETNVGRFVEKVREMSANIQFIVITHNKRTMEAARALYGVTMEEAGISKIVSVKFE